MDASEFQHQVRWLGRLLSEESLSCALAHYVEDIGRFDHAAVRQCVQLAGRIEATFGARRQPPSNGTPACEALIGSEERTERIRPLVEQVRQELFGTSQPPMQTPREAFTGVRAIAGERLLQAKSRDIAEATAFSVSAVTSYILSGVMPFLSAMELRIERPQLVLPTNETVQFPRGILEINWGILSFDQSRIVEREIRRNFSTQKLKHLTASDRQLLAIVQGFGGPPAVKFDPAFWKKVQAQWNREVADPQYRSWRGLADRYYRLKQKVVDHLH
jgi:hypothetical protein